MLWGRETNHPMMWQAFDIAVQSNWPSRLDVTDQCYFAREYAAGQGFAHSSTNSLISNFKKPVSERGKPSWRYKTRAIDQFAKELRELFAELKGPILLAAIPSSKRKSEEDYDDRLPRVVKLVADRHENVTACEPIERRCTMPACHLAGSRRPRPSDVQDSLAWVGRLSVDPRPLIFLDDVITTGTTFKACQRLVHQKQPGRTVIGVFWARTVHDDDDLPD